MILCHNLCDLPPLPSPIVLTLGTFDGVHAGHRFIFSEMKKRGTAVVLTFSNHPAEILRGQAPPLLTTLQEKLSLLEASGVDAAVVLPFTRALADLAYDQFLIDIRKYLPFSLLMLGEGASFGHRNEGSAPAVQALGKKLGFEALYLPKLMQDGEPISSHRLRLAAGVCS